MIKKMPLQVAGLFIGLLLITFALIAVAEKYILTVNFYERSGQAVSGIPEQEALVYQSIQKWIYLYVAAYLLIKVILITLVCYTALYLAGRSVSVQDTLFITLIAEYIFFIPAAVKVIWFLWNVPDPELALWQRFYFLSALSLLQNVPAVWVYPLQTLNMFEVGYWFLLAFGVHRISRMSFDESLSLVLKSYLPALILWILLVCLITIVLFPQAR